MEKLSEPWSDKRPLEWFHTCKGAWIKLIKLPYVESVRVDEAVHFSSFWLDDVA